jgi:hypothetical protein
MAFNDNRRLLRARFVYVVGPLVLLLGIGLGSSAVLAWTAGIVLALLTLNMLIPIGK